MKINKRVCIFSAQYLPSSYGVEKYTFHIADKLNKNGVEVTIVTSDLYGVPVYEQQENIKIYRLPSIGLMNNRLPIVRYNAGFRRKMKVIFSKRYDLVIINTRFYPLSLIGAGAGKRYADRSIVIEHGTAHIQMQSGLVSYIGQIYEHIITFLIKQNVKEFYGVSKACNQWLRHFGIRSKGCLYNAVDWEEIMTLAHKPTITMKEKLKIAKNDMIVSFSGRILEEKGIFQLLQAFNSVRDEYPAVNLVIAGDGPKMQLLREKSGAGVYLLGQVKHEEVIALLQDSDIFCLPSAYAEGMPTSILEAAACRNCIISTDCGGAKEIIPNKSYGIIIENNNAQTIASALRTVIKDQAYREQTAVKVNKRVREYFIWDKVVDKLQRELL